MKNNTVKFALATTLFGLVMSANAALPSYNFTDLGTLGGTYSNASDINNISQVAGNAYTTGDSSSHASIWNNATAMDLTPGIPGSSSVANAINNSGQ
ncbi:MAG: hypothetical protein B7Y34_03625, partial [Methylophilales bacterium 16-45-9]